MQYLPSSVATAIDEYFLISLNTIFEKFGNSFTFSVSTWKCCYPQQKGTQYYTGLLIFRNLKKCDAVPHLH